MTKVELFDRELQETAAVFKAMSNPARLAILKYLAQTKVCISGDISDELPLSRTTVHQHLTELKKIGLIKGVISGVRTNYCLDTEKINSVKAGLDQFFTDMNYCADTTC